MNKTIRRIYDYALVFLPRKNKREIKELVAFVLITDFALSLVWIFTPIFLYDQGFSLLEILVFFFTSYLLYFFLLPLAGKMIKSWGFEHCMFYSNFFTILFYLSLYGITYSKYMIVASCILMAVDKMIYWPAYHCDLAMFSSPTAKGRQINLLYILDSIVCIIAPVIGGLILANLGFRFLFICVSFLLMLAGVPLFTTIEKFEPESFSYKDAIKRVFKKENRRKLISYLGFGEEMIGIYIWPIFVYLVVINFFNIGLIFSGATLIMILSTIFVGKMVDQRDKRKILKWGTAMLSLSWLAKIFIRTPLSLFAVESFSEVSKKVVTVPQMAIIYQDAKKSHLVKKIVFLEMSLAIGKIAIIAVLIGFSFFFSEITVLQISFILAAAMSLLYSLL